MSSPRSEATRPSVLPTTDAILCIKESGIGSEETFVVMTSDYIYCCQFVQFDSPVKLQESHRCDDFRKSSTFSVTAMMYPYGTFVSFSLFLAVTNFDPGTFLQVEARPSRSGGSPSKPSSPSFPSPSVPTFPSSPSLPTSPSVPTNPSTSTDAAVIFVPSIPTYNRQNYRPVNHNGQDCVEQTVNITDPVLNETETNTEIICVANSSNSSKGNLSVGAIMSITLGVLFTSTIL